jgi:hypothetical protein
MRCDAVSKICGPSGSEIGGLCCALAAAATIAGNSAEANTRVLIRSLLSIVGVRRSL